MKNIAISILEMIKESKNYKKMVWIFISMLLLLIMVYPIIDANFLYYRRVSNRIDILNKITNIDINKIGNNQKLEQEYNSIINEISEKEDNYLNNIFITKESEKHSIIKIVSSGWMFIVVAVIVLFTKDKKTGKINKMNVISAILSIVIAVIFGYLGYIIPTIINVAVNMILYQVILIYLAYSIATLGEKEKVTRK